ncbi:MULTISPECIES: hypothetical protein [unclassified Sedimentibacter]|uniref:hypothetical protein n=1 Tax=unclassified Sedimentibacter TaxID=2649220 RepID=UPI0027DF73F0|nr:hypothetical protein [Sedimentibacter sp. MB35-C1]WMJ77124.1 hypothetical protein RBQ61_16355 [Sedimentibacter sp. MB35-C1]
MKNLGIFSSDDIYNNMGLLVSGQCKHSIKFAIFQGIDKLVFKDRKELTGSLFAQLTDTCLSRVHPDISALYLDYFGNIEGKGTALKQIVQCLAA